MEVDCYRHLSVTNVNRPFCFPVENPTGLHNLRCSRDNVLFFFFFFFFLQSKPIS